MTRVRWRAYTILVEESTWRESTSIVELQRPVHVSVSIDSGMVEGN